MQILEKDEETRVCMYVRERDKIKVRERQRQRQGETIPFQGSFRWEGEGGSGRWEGGSGWETHVCKFMADHVNVWQNPQYCKVISLQLN